jgi:hypothetical protein
MEMQYNSLLHNRNCYVTMEIPSRPNISQYNIACFIIIFKSFPFLSAGKDVGLHKGVMAYFIYSAKQHSKQILEYVHQEKTTSD